MFPVLIYRAHVLHFIGCALHTPSMMPNIAVFLKAICSMAFAHIVAPLVTVYRYNSCIPKDSFLKDLAHHILVFCIKNFHPPIVHCNRIHRYFHRELFFHPLMVTCVYFTRFPYCKLLTTCSKRESTMTCYRIWGLFV